MKITLATVKKLIKDNTCDLHIKTVSGFDPMTDGLTTDLSATFRKAFVGNPMNSMPSANTLGIDGAWFVLGGRDHFTAYDDGKFGGVEVSNGCGRFILAVPIRA